LRGAFNAKATVESKAILFIIIIFFFIPTVLLSLLSGGGMRDVGWG
jgi:hypothetical protein